MTAHRLRRVAIAMLFVYGGSVALVAAARAIDLMPNGVVLMDGRIAETQGALRTLRAGGPPLLVTPAEGRPIGPAGPGDDQGIYVFVPLAGLISGLSDARIILNWLVIGLFAPLFVLYPWLMLRLFGSWAAAIAAPLTLFAAFDLAIGSGDVYWSSAWALAFALPFTLLLIAGKPLGAGAWRVVLLVAVAASFATSIRSQAGLPSVLGLGMAILVASRTWRVRVLLLSIALVGYALVEPIGTDVTRAYRDRAVGVDLSSRYGTSHIVWHNAYIGLGYLPNPYGLAWDDAVAIRAAEAASLGVRNLSPEYEKVMQGLFFDIVRKDPGFVIENVVTKLDVVLRDAIAQSGFVLLLLPLAVSCGPWRRTMRFAALLALLAVPTSLAAPVLAIPLPQYELGWLGTWALLYALCLVWLAASAGPVSVRALRLVQGRRTSSLLMRNGRIGATLGVGRTSFSLRWAVAVGLATTLVFALGLATNDRAELAELPPLYRSGESRLTPADSPLLIGTTLTQGPHWSFTSGMPKDWEAFRGVKLAPSSSGLVVNTNANPVTYQLWSAELTVDPGSYAFVIDGRIESGGTDLGVLDSTTNTWLVTTNYWYGQDFNSALMIAPFKTAAPKRIRLVLSNWAPHGGSSTWRLSEAFLAKLAQ